MNKVEYSKKYRLEHKGDINFWFTKTYGRLLGYDSSLIARACRLNKVSKGYRWEYV